MNTGYTIKNNYRLRSLLRVDYTLGALTAFAGLMFYRPLEHLLGLPQPFIFVSSLVNALYATVAFTLATQRNLSIRLLRVLIGANWFWTLLSVASLYVHHRTATEFGLVVLLLQLVIVGVPAYLEGNQLTKLPKLELRN